MYSAAMTAGIAALSPRRLLAESKGIVPTMIDAAAKAEIKVRAVRRNISVLEGSGGNIAVLAGNDGILLVDSGFTVSRKRIRQALSGISSAPLAKLINTHWHVDHTDGNAWVHAAGAEVTAHRRTKEHLVASTRVEAWQFTFPPAPAGAVPTRVFDEADQMQHSDTHLEMRYYGPAHTDSDIYVLFQEADVVHVGDTWWNGVYPFIDYSTGGSIDAMIRAAEKNLGLVMESTVVIPGHGSIGNKADISEFRDMLVAIRSNVADLKKKGKTLDETIAARPTAPYDAKWGQFLITPAFFTGLVYAGV